MAKRTNATEPMPMWEKFQNDVAHLFRISGYDVKQDLLVEFKKVDLLITERRFGRLHRIAVECKCWDRTLTQQSLSEIYANYLPLIPSAVHELLVVTKEALTETASAMVDRAANLRHLTYSELHAYIMDFRQYLAHLVDGYSSDGLNTYYISPTSSDMKDLAYVVDEWLADTATPPQPLAILGSYGLGKSTFARHIAWKYASLALKDPVQRIPILVKLGEIANEQSLAGLLGKLFTATNFVRNYNYSTFLELNKLGRFLVIFDGFDEMKQMLSWGEFKNNLREMNRLVQGSGKVLILGRPTAFLTAAEHQYALHGERNLASYQTRDPEWPDYKEVDLATFTKEQIEAFLPKYLKYLIDTSKNANQRGKLERLVNRDAKDLLGDGQIWDIVKRPVQLKMITEILPDLRNDIEELTVHDLYDYFIDYVIERESSKAARGGFKTEQRRAFARDVAFWLWNVKRDRGVAEHAIPADLVAPYCGPNEDLDDVTRDLVSACVLDRQGDRLFFPHRSFQEFLVAEAVHRKVLDKKLTIAELQFALSAQVLEFLEGFVDKRFLDAIARQMNAFRGTLSLRFLQLLSERMRYRHFAPDTPWGNLLIAIAVRDKNADEDDLVKSMHMILNTTTDTKVAFSAVFSTLVASGGREDPASLKSSKIIGASIEALCRIVQTLSRKDRERTEFSAKGVKNLVKCLKYSESKGRGIDISRVYEVLFEEIKGFCFISDWVTARTGASSKFINFKEVGLPGRIAEWRDGAIKFPEWRDGAIKLLDSSLGENT